MAIKIKRNEAGNCINFEGTSNPTYWNACLSGEVDSVETDSVNVINDVITADTGKIEYEFFRIPYTTFVDADGNGFADAQECADYITTHANVIGFTNDSGTDLTNEVVDFKLDATNTSVLLDNGYHYGVNAIKAVGHTDGTIHIKAIQGDITYFTKLDHTNVTVDGNIVAGGLQDVVNTLNELFTVGAFEAVVISDPYSTMVADVNGVDIVSPTYIGSGIDPVGNDVFGSSSSGALNGYLSTETINQAGEYFTFDIRVEGTIGFGLVHSQDSYDNGYYSGNANYANPTTFGTSNSSHYGFQFSHWFHPTPNGSWTNYGANTSYSMRAGWSNFNGTDEQADWLAGNPIKVRVGLDANGFISIETLRNGTDWIPHVRTSYPSIEGVEYRLGIKTGDTNVRLYSLPKVHLLEETAPTMYFRYIESPDGVFQYPLFATEEEANYYDLQEGGTGTSHTHTYADDPTNTTWYMPDTNSTMVATVPPTNAQTFEGNPINWTEVTSLTNSDLTPTQFGASDITQEEGTNVNIQVTPAGASWTTSVSITPSGSGLVYDNYSVIQGTLADVGADTTYTITVTRANSYGSSVGSMTVTATDVAPAQSHTTTWTKALDFSGGAERAQQVTSDSNRIPIKMAGTNNQVSAPTTSGNTVASGHPWATAVVFKVDTYNSNQHIWNLGEGAGTTDDNIFLRRSSDRRLYLGWGRDGDISECEIADISGSMSSWHAVYIAHNGTRYGSNNTASLMADAFDIRYTNGSSSWTIGSNLSTASNWSITGDGRMNRQYQGDMTIGGRGANRTFRGKIASMVITTLRCNVAMPTNAEIAEMITDPKDWLTNYKVGQSFRLPWQTSDSGFNFSLNDGSSAYSTQVWLMGDGTNDSYSNMIRNQVQPSDQNYTKLNLISMVSNDIENVNINGLT